MSVASSFDVINRQNLQFATPRYEKLFEMVKTAVEIFETRYYGLV
jgi:hypothetical protein